jgi:hypothetical protein
MEKFGAIHGLEKKKQKMGGWERNEAKSLCSYQC